MDLPGRKPVNGCNIEPVIGSVIIHFGRQLIGIREA
jgi:hypothetical protein